MANARRKIRFLLGRILTNSSRLKFLCVFFPQNFTIEFIDKSLKFIRKIFHARKYFLCDYFDLEKKKKIIAIVGEHSPRTIRIKQQDKQKSLYITREGGGGGMNIRKTERGKCPGILIKNLD